MNFSASLDAVRVDPFRFCTKMFRREARSLKVVHSSSDNSRYDTVVVVCEYLKATNIAVLTPSPPPKDSLDPVHTWTHVTPTTLCGSLT